MDEEKFITPKEALLEKEHVQGNILRLVNALLAVCPIKENADGERYIECHLPFDSSFQEDIKLTKMAQNAGWGRTETVYDTYNDETNMKFYLGK